ncbi:MAG: HNH endonuclease [Prevotellaceae bacterium]|nr:HNH endonuclease [Candidatus Faecinaster equi]
MPKSPKRPCRYPSCPCLTDDKSGYCELHRKSERRKYDRYERDPEIKKIYGRRWEKIRDNYILHHPLCEQCLSEGESVLAEEVHHILPVKRGGTHDLAEIDIFPQHR